MTQQWPSAGLGRPRAAAGSSHSLIQVQSRHPVVPLGEGAEFQVTAMAKALKA